MKYLTLAPIHWIFLAASMVSFNGCTSLKKHSARATHDHAFIQYWPQPREQGRIRLAVKDIIDMKGYVTSAGSEHLWKNRPPATKDAKCLAGARARNVQFVGKTNTTEFAMTASGLNDYFGTPKNRLGDQKHLIPGGSSCGSAVAVARDEADVAYGTDTAGSIRVPAACCGIAGLKTTFGLIPLDGVYPVAPQHLDTVGPMAKDVAGLVVGMDLLTPGFTAKYAKAKAAAPRGVRITVGRFYVKGTDLEIDAAVDAALEAAGFKIVQIDAGFEKKWLDAQRDVRILALSEAWQTNRKYSQAGGVSSRTKTVLALGALESTFRYRTAVSHQAAWRETVEDVLEKVDFIALPTLKREVPRLPFLRNSAAFEETVYSLQNTPAVNFSGNPALALPIPARDEEEPVTSLQLIGRAKGEAALLNAGRIVEAANKGAIRL